MAVMTPQAPDLRRLSYSPAARVPGRRPGCMVVAPPRSVPPWLPRRRDARIYGSGWQSVHAFVSANFASIVRASSALIS